MSEEKGSYYLSEGEDGLDSVQEEMDNLISEESYRDAFWMMPNIVDDMDISKEAFRVYSHLKSVCGDRKKSSVWQSTKTISIYCDMGTGTVSRAKEELQNYFIPLIRVTTKRKKQGGIYHDITILDIWKINEKYSKNKKIFKFEKVEKYEKMKEERKNNLRVSSMERGLEGRSSPVETNNTTINNTTYLPASAGGKLCECEDNEMCEKCEFLKQKIAVGEAFGFDFDVQKTKEQLIAVELAHGETEVQSKTTDQKIFDMTRGNGYSDRLNDYPERCKKPLAYFVKKWGLSETSIPKKPKSSKGGLYATWIAGIDDLLSISGEKKFYAVIDKVYELWFSYAPEYRTPVDMPQKIKKMFVSLDGEIRNSEIEIMKEAVERAKLAEKNKVESEEYVNAEDGINLLKKLKKSIK